MIFIDGECPLCQNMTLQLNLDDLFECPNCHFQLSMADPICAAALPNHGQGKFRDDDTKQHKISGAAVAPAIPGTALPNLKQMFESNSELIAYLDNPRD